MSGSGFTWKELKGSFGAPTPLEGVHGTDASPVVAGCVIVGAALIADLLFPLLVDHVCLGFVLIQTFGIAL